ncbi:HPF/RaiA family ribosome-associated protein [Caenimonas aquaedulcis]|uniref:HPF/RaiA family ribosome-associated protein n=1 Tax=Caenimonas aquaedulcis TaxID=2793270 RepID=A0A931H393_9BURK|nr:HPF/RaiA family ribosome-associated protein [Caenimonas aquaedulcis]MBG9387786.1 HPF/RaiA family ribosome-associated protein [Caenimonas aquaedulcis]
MQVQVNTSNGIENSDTLQAFATEYLNTSLSRFTADLTRVEVQLSDENSERKGAADKRCMLEARMNGHAPLAVSHHAENQDLAFRGATQKLIHLLDHQLGKQDRQDHRARETIRKDAPVAE